MKDLNRLSKVAGEFLEKDLAEQERKSFAGITRETFRIGVSISPNRYAWHDATVIKEVKSGEYQDPRAITPEDAVRMAGKLGIVWHVVETRTRIK